MVRPRTYASLSSDRYGKPTHFPTVRWRAIAIGLFLIPLNCLWILEMENIWYSGQATLSTLFFNAIFSLFLVFGANLLIRRVVPSQALNRAELLTIYTMVCIASAIAGHHFLPMLVQTLPHAYWYASPTNEWTELVHPFVPDWMAVKDKAIIRGYYEGDSTLWTPERVMGWLGPLTWWSLFMLALLGVMLCLCALARRRWVEEEKLAYPIVRLPLAMTVERTGFYRSHLLWVGFAIGAGIDTMNGLHYFVPQIPFINVKVQGLTIFHERPWSAFGPFPFSFYPFIVGMCFFMPLELSFSLWFFVIARQCFHVFADAVGLHIRSRGVEGGFWDLQQTGGWLGLVMIAVWSIRRYFVRGVRQAFHPKSGPDGELGTEFRWALAGLAIFGSFLVAFSYVAGMSMWAILGFFGITYGIFFAMSRARAELGPPYTGLWQINGREIMVRFLGSRVLGPRNLAPMAFFYFFTRNYPSHPMPHYIENMKIAERGRIGLRKLTIAGLLATAVTIPVSLWMTTALVYRFGGMREFAGWEAFGEMSRRVAFPSGPNSEAIFLTSIGTVMTFVLMVLRTRYVWWPLHPAGYVLSFDIGTVLSPLLIAFFAKWLILRLGGLRAHEKAVPLFLGLILGEFIVGSFWSALGIVLQVPTYTFSIH